MMIKLVFALVFLFHSSQDKVNCEIVGHWNEPPMKSMEIKHVKLGGEDFGVLKTAAHSKASKRAPMFIFNKNGTGLYKAPSHVHLSQRNQEFSFTWVLSDAENSDEKRMFIAFDKPFAKQETPLLVLRIKKNQSAEIELTAIKKNSPLGDRINGVTLERSKNTAK